MARSKLEKKERNKLNVTITMFRQVNFIRVYRMKIIFTAKSQNQYFFLSSPEKTNGDFVLDPAKLTQI